MHLAYYSYIHTFFFTAELKETKAWRPHPPQHHLLVSKLMQEDQHKQLTAHQSRMSKNKLIMKTHI